MARLSYLFVILTTLLVFSNAFVPQALSPTRTPPFPLFASRVNAKKEKRLRNRDNMRQFKSKRGSSRRRLMKKLASNAERQGEMEFVAKLFQTVEGPQEPEIRDNDRRR
ncbi:hypothetical protein TrCOL_g7405 [Triparma columacea]|uniref:Uncharacterized protein n=1 Tax=Triparma columacea TaxID=722753 RepID=A0A9W7L2A4_9STRA|nr:hypothetical protein TrCOL_g7405 [Triparma columacea]